MNELEVNPQLNLAASVFENETWVPCDINNIHMLAKKFLVQITAGYNNQVIGTHDYYDKETYEIWLETMQMEVEEREAELSECIYKSRNVIDSNESFDTISVGFGGGWVL